MNAGTAPVLIFNPTYQSYDVMVDGRMVFSSQVESEAEAACERVTVSDSATAVAQAEAAAVAAWNLPNPQGGDPDFWALKHARFSALADAFEGLLQALPVHSGSYYAALAALGDAERRRDIAATHLARTAVSS